MKKKPGVFGDELEVLKSRGGCPLARKALKILDGAEVCLKATGKGVLYEGLSPEDEEKIACLLNKARRTR
jgi:hypothetical protein